MTMFDWHTRSHLINRRWRKVDFLPYVSYIHPLIKLWISQNKKEIRLVKGLVTSQYQQQTRCLTVPFGVFIRHDFRMSTEQTESVGLGKFVFTKAKNGDRLG